MTAVLWCFSQALARFVAEHDHKDVLASVTVWPSPDRPGAAAWLQAHEHVIRVDVRDQPILGRRYRYVSLTQASGVLTVHRSYRHEIPEVSQ